MIENIQTASNSEDEKMEAKIVFDKINDKTSDFTEELEGGKAKKTERRQKAENLSEEGLTPLQKNDIAWRQSEKEKNDAKTACWKAAKHCLYALSVIIGGVLIVVTVGWAYHLSSISEPIGGIKQEIGDLKKYNDEEVKPRLKDWDSAQTQLKVKKIILQ